MLFRRLFSGMLLMLCLGFCGCYPGAEAQVDEQKNPYFLAGRERVAERDYKGAIEAFEKAVESNPRSVQAHFELGVLYEQHSDQKEEDYVSAMFHYIQAIKLRPNDYPADNARQRIGSCKRELVKAESLAPVAQNLMRELDKLKEENHVVRKQLEAAQADLRGAVQARSPSNRTDKVLLPAPTPAQSSDSAATLNRTSAPPSRERAIPPPTPTPAARTHTVKSGDTAYSIARQYHVKLEALMSANPALDPKHMKVGQLVNVPST